ncbi:hypothetical protein Csa_011998 [Cucumis sativus]|uniref:Uncharacterized protein n=1 Tax=Cucumis sativus TaxID=3659 RepID=A0A0A0L228_CUCSA|nr:hypothetical protein Csa_011998 [Cucumis sativus]
MNCSVNENEIKSFRVYKNNPKKWGMAEWVVTQKWGKTRVGKGKEKEKKGREETVLVREKASTCRWVLPFVVLEGTVPFLKAILLSWLGDQP